MTVTPAIHHQDALLFTVKILLKPLSLNSDISSFKLLSLKTSSISETLKITDLLSLIAF